MAEFATFQELYQTYMPKVYRYMFFRLGQRKEVAEELTSEVFLRALENFVQYDASRPFSAWIFAIAKNRLTDYFKKNAKEKTVNLDELENVLHAPEMTERTAGKALTMQELHRAIRELPDEQQELIRLRYFSGYSYKEMAEILQKEEGTVKVAAFRVVQELKKKLLHLTDSEVL